jgi:membrane protein YqaA with SNARE-associated domain
MGVIILARGAKNPWILVILLIIGGLFGTLLGQAFGDFLPILKTSFPPIGFEPTTINLAVINVTIGILIKVNLASIIGFLLALFIYFRL